MCARSGCSLRACKRQRDTHPLHLSARPASVSCTRSCEENSSSGVCALRDLAKTVLATHGRPRCAHLAGEHCPGLSCEDYSVVSAQGTRVNGSVAHAVLRVVCTRALTALVHLLCAYVLRSHLSCVHKTSAASVGSQANTLVALHGYPWALLRGNEREKGRGTMFTFPIGTACCMVQASVTPTACWSTHSCSYCASSHCVHHSQRGFTHICGTTN